MGWRMRFTYEKYHNPTLNSVDEEEEQDPGMLTSMGALSA